MADTITLAIDALASAAFIEGGVSIERTDEAREFTEQRKRELIEAIAVGQLQAVAAQAPAAVAVPEGWKLVPLEPTHDMLAQASMRLQQNTFPAESELEFQADAHTAWDAMLSVAPELPATEDSSAGDVVEVQAEPVAWRYKRRGDCFGDFWFKPAGKSADYLRIGREDGVVLAPCPDHFDWTPLYTAPQAQPADALDAAPAAPAADALLEALESMVDVCESLDFDGAPSDASMIKARAAIAAYRATPAAANAKPADALLLHALELACDHIDMDSLRISHCKDAAAIDAAMAAAQEGGNAAKGM